MFWRAPWRKELRMVWRVERGPRTSFLVGTAHFSPYSFKKSLGKLLNASEFALFEGPLDPFSMERVVAAGMQGEDGGGILDRLDEKTISKVADVLDLEAPRDWVFPAGELTVSEAATRLARTLGPMRPWMIFFGIYTAYLKKIGWTHSVDMEAYAIACALRKRIVFMETIEDQIEVLETLSHQQIADFLKRIDSWDCYTRDFMRWYLDGNLASIAGNPYGFPTRNPTVIDSRDAVFCEKMKPYLDSGSGRFSWGRAHVVGIKKILTEAGYTVEHDWQA